MWLLLATSHHHVARKVISYIFNFGNRQQRVTSLVFRPTLSLRNELLLLMDRRPNGLHSFQTEFWKEMPDVPQFVALYSLSASKEEDNTQVNIISGNKIIKHISFCNLNHTVIIQLCILKLIGYETLQ
jgi:hypothetical protein